MRLNPNRTDQSAPGVMHAGNMAVRFLVARPCFINVQYAQDSSVTASFFPSLNRSLLPFSSGFASRTPGAP